MQLFIAGLIFTALTLYALRGGLVGRTHLTIVGFDIESLALGGLAVIFAAWFFGPLYGLALVLCVMIHEFGHVAAYRVAGHADARFRLIPLMGGVAISDSMPVSQMKDFFITLLGPGICIAPMVLAFGLSELLYDVQPLASQFLFTFASVTAAINFLNLLPFWPLDGGRCVRILAFAIHPSLAHVITIAMSAGLAAAAVYLQSLILFAFAVMGAQSVMHADTLSRIQYKMTLGQTITAALAYLFTAGAHLAGGWWLISRYIS